MIEEPRGKSEDSKGSFRKALAGPQGPVSCARKSFCLPGGSLSRNSATLQPRWALTLVPLLDPLPHHLRLLNCKLDFLEAYFSYLSERQVRLAASVIAIDLSAKVTVLCLEHSSAVGNAGANIARPGTGWTTLAQHSEGPRIFLVAQMVKRSRRFCTLELE
ncbi:hypothetical protein BKA56DRAFT_199461 [Ilyonectria sp. MPI-CAGE-AT-0026]|nr:hypothetical protein BKA56DRAFT_199461 [Ilyonectria sp. MPI-CAGE-AT-0026]